VSVSSGESQFFIDGSWADPAGDGHLDVVNPATEKVHARVPLASAPDIDRAVAAARLAFDEGPWPRMPVTERVEIVRAALDILDDQTDEIAQVITAEMGAPVTFSRLQGPGALSTGRAYAQVALDTEWEVFRGGRRSDALVLREPAGVVAAVAPWNGPFGLAVHKVVPAVLAGCTTVFKAAPETPLDAYYLAEALAQAGVPHGVVNMVPGATEAGRHLVAHPDVDLVTFTGSTAAGRDIGATCGGQLKRAHLELGGKSAAILLEDVDVAGTIPALAAGAFTNSGQICSLCTRVLVHRSRYADVVDGLAEAARSLRVGDPLDERTQLGPLVARRQRDRVEGYIAAGIDEGARLVVGGGRPGGLDVGWYVEPTVFADVDNRMRIAQEEIFGPVVSIIPFDDVEEAVRIANDSPYGLSGAVHSADEEHATRVARRIVTGAVTVNGFLTANPDCPFGGRKASGIGREYGPEGFSEFLEYKTVNLPVSRAAG